MRNRKNFMKNLKTTFKTVHQEIFLGRPSKTRKVSNSRGLEPVCLVRKKTNYTVTGSKNIYTQSLGTNYFFYE